MVENSSGGLTSIYFSDLLRMVILIDSSFLALSDVKDLQIPAKQINILALLNLLIKAEFILRNKEIDELESKLFELKHSINRLIFGKLVLILSKIALIAVTLQLHMKQLNLLSVFFGKWVVSVLVAKKHC